MDIKPPTLKGAEAMALWRQGCDKWNAWVDQHPNTDIDFSGQDFIGNMTMAGCHFPLHGNVNFSEATFGDVYVSFRKAKFGKGIVDFSYAKFGEGDVLFNTVTFGKGVVDFSRANFGKWEVNFNFAKFGKGIVTFSFATFGEGGVSFNKAIFGGEVCFDAVTFGSGEYDFETVTFPDRVWFRKVLQADKVTAFSLRYSSFAKSLSFSSESPFGCVPDLRDTHIGYHMALQGFACKPQQTTAEDIDRLCRLKELAQNNQDTEHTLAFNELRAIRKHQPRGIPWLLNGCFEFFSDYGRSEWRPFLSLLVVWFFFGVAYS